MEFQVEGDPDPLDIEFIETQIRREAWERALTTALQGSHAPRAGRPSIQHVLADVYRTTTSPTLARIERQSTNGSKEAKSVLHFRRSTKILTGASISITPRLCLTMVHPDSQPGRGTFAEMVAFARLGSVACQRLAPDVEGFHALALLRLIKPPLTDNAIVAKEKEVKRLRDRLGLRRWCRLYAGEMEQARILVEVLRRQN